MKGSPEEARVLYAKIESDSLQKIADAITNSYIHAGIQIELIINYYHLNF